METNKTIDLMNYVKFPKRYTEAKGKLVAQPITTINSARRVENEDMTVCYILDQDDDVMDFIFDRDIITVLKTELRLMNIFVKLYLTQMTHLP